MSSAARAFSEPSYWEQFFGALQAATTDDAQKWMDAEVSRYMSQFGMDEETAWRSIACNLACFAGYYGKGAVLTMRRLYGIFPECFDSPEYRQDKRRSMSGAATFRESSPV